MKKRWIALAAAAAMLLGGILPVQAVGGTTETLAPTNALYIRTGSYVDTEYSGKTLVNDLRKGYTNDSNGWGRIPYLRFDLTDVMDKLEELEKITLRLSTTKDMETKNGTNLGERNFKIYLMPQAAEQWWSDSAKKTWTTAETAGLSCNTDTLLTDTTVTLAANTAIESGDILAGIKTYLAANPSETAVTMMYELSGTYNLSICNGLDAADDLKPALTFTYRISDAEIAQLDAKALTFEKLSAETASSITKKLTLPQTGENGSTISWTEESGRIDTETGAVTRPAYGEGNAAVTLKARVSYGSATKEVSFALTILADDGIPRVTKTLAATNALYVRAGAHVDKEYIGSSLINDLRKGYTNDSTGWGRIPYLRFDLTDYMDKLEKLEEITLRVTTTKDSDAGGGINTGKTNYRIYLMPQTAETWLTDANVKKTWTTAAEQGLTNQPSNLLAETPVTLANNTTYESGNLLAGIKAYLAANPMETAVTLVYELSGASNLSICNGLDAADTVKPTISITYRDENAGNVLKDAAALTFEKISTETADHITKNLTLPQTGEFGSTISWTEESGRIDTETGAVTRPAYGEGNAAVTLKAVVSYGGATQEVTFALTILEEEPDTSDIPRVTETLPAAEGVYIRGGAYLDKEYIGSDLINDIRPGYAESNGQTRVPYLRFDLADYMDKLDDIERITLCLTTKGVEYHTGARTFGVYLMPQEAEEWWTATDEQGNPIVKTWTTAKDYGMPGNKDQCLAAGTVTLAAELTIESGNLLEGIKEHLKNHPQDTVVTLMYELAGGENLSICYGINGNDTQRPALNITYFDMDAYYAQCDAEALTFDKLSPERQDSVSKALHLPTTGENGSTIRWSAEGGTIHAETGAVTRPAYGEPDNTVTLKATVSHGEAEKTVAFTVTVLADRTDPIFAGKNIPACDSTYVRSDAAGETASAEHLIVGDANSVRKTAFVKVDFTDSLALVQNAGALYLRMMPDGGMHTGPVRIYGIDTDWTGATLNYELAEQKGLLNGTLLSEYDGALAANTYVDSENLINYIRGQLEAGSRTAAFRIETEGGQYTLHGTAASSDLKPMLIVVNEQDAVKAALEALTLETITTEKPAYIRGDLTLPQEGRYETNIVWNAAPAGIVAPDGTLTRPAENTPVTLTATVSSGSVSQTKTFQVTVCGQETPEQYIEWLFDQVTFPLSVLTGDIALPTVSGTEITWRSADTYEMMPDGDMLRIKRPKSKDLVTTLTGEISYQGTVGTRDYSFVILRDPKNDVLYGSRVTSADKGAAKALDDNPATVWEFAGGQTLTLDLSTPKALAAFTVIPAGSGFSGLKAEVSTDGHSWKQIYAGGTFRENQVGGVALETPAYGRYLRFTFPAGGYGIRMLCGYAEGGASAVETLDTIVLPSAVTNNFTLPQRVGGEEIRWSSGNTAAIRIEGEKAIVTRAAQDITVTLTGRTSAETRLFQVVVKRAAGAGNAGGGGGGGAGNGIGSVTNQVVLPPVSNPDITQNGSSAGAEKNTGYFSDLETVPWAAGYIVALAERGVVSGKAAGIYAPDDRLKREEFAKLLTEAFGLEKVPAASYADVETGFWYDDYVGAVCSVGISNGIGNGLFGTGLEITRQDAMCQLARVLKLNGIQASAAQPFADDGAIADYARDSIYLLKGLGIVGGDETNCVNPEESISRAEIAKIVYLAMQQIGR
ncbi:MAG: hypothetical protein HFI90_05800 [Clostridia bacterium]|nr:hypothetical protein [Clostridia bacterium]